MVIPLNYLEPDQQAEVVWLAYPPDAGQYFMDLGFAPGERVVCLLRAAKNGMSAYRVSDAVIALRAEDARWIFVQK